MTRDGKEHARAGSPQSPVGRPAASPRSPLVIGHHSPTTKYNSSPHKMAGAGKFNLLSARVLLLSAVFITLSGYGAEGRQCYWCGPLAEQVHRSPRAPPCDGSAARHITVCEPGYDHCAIVATSPPYLESRLCVKFYQDECYPLFCNSTKTWKMTCPCRGDLCNGANAEREEDAFSALSKLLAKTHSRVKKRAPSIHLTGNRKGRIVNPEPDNDHLHPGEEEKDTQDNTLKQNDSLTINNETLNNEQVTEETVTGHTPASHATSTSDQPLETEKKESENPTINEAEQTKNYADIQTTINSKSESESGSNIQVTFIDKEMENTKQSSTVMIEIDIIQRPSTLAQQDIKNTVPETHLQADEPVHQKDQSEVDDKNSEGEDHAEETKTNESTTSSLTIHSSESITTSRSPQTEMTVNADDKIATNTNIKTFESTPAENVEKVEALTTKVLGKPVTEKPNTMSSIERLSTIAPTAHQGTSQTVGTSVTQSSKDKKNKNNIATNVTINTLVIINCILLSTFI